MVSARACQLLAGLRRAADAFEAMSADLELAEKQYRPHVRDALARMLPFLDAQTRGTNPGFRGIRGTTKIWPAR